MREELLTELQKHYLEYLLLALASIFFLIFISLFSGQHLKQFFLLLIFTLYYLVWGAVHHSKDQSLSLKIMLEYGAIGALALVILYSIILR